MEREATMTKAEGDRRASVGGKTPARRPRKKMMPHEFLLKVARGETIDGHVPSFEQRLDAARQILPYYAPRLSPESASDGKGEGLSVTVVRFSDEESAEASNAPA